MAGDVLPTWGHSPNNINRHEPLTKVTVSTTKSLKRVRKNVRVGTNRELKATVSTSESFERHATNRSDFVKHDDGHA